VVLLALLFRIIARAADDFFSCILSQISQDLGLPPRLGGVTLLALGNGAPDLSASIAAVKSGALGRFEVGSGVYGRAGQICWLGTVRCQAQLALISSSGIAEQSRGGESVRCVSCCGERRAKAEVLAILHLAVMAAC
jgi:Ca2+/Na+ antiporter